MIPVISHGELWWERKVKQISCFIIFFKTTHYEAKPYNGGYIEKLWTIWLLLHMIDLDIITNVIVSFWLRVIMCVFVWIPIVFFFVF